MAEHLGTEEVTAGYRAARDPVERDRWQMIRLLVAGRPLADVAEATGYSTRWVREVVRRYNEQGRRTAWPTGGTPTRARRRS